MTLIAGIGRGPSGARTISLGKNGDMIDGRLREVVDAAWAEALGCNQRIVRTPGSHLVRGGLGFEGYNAVYVARIEDAVLVYCPESLQAAALEVLAGCNPDDVFTGRTLERIAGDRGLITRPDHRGRGCAKRLASQMIADALPDAEVVRYRALRTMRPRSPSPAP